METNCTVALIGHVYVTLKLQSESDGMKLCSQSWNFNFTKQQLMSSVENGHSFICLVALLSKNRR